MKNVLWILAVLLLLTCTRQERARRFGGTAEISLPLNEKLITITWKEDSIWYLTKPMNDQDKPETYIFRESAPMGALEGKVIIKESRTF